MLFSHAHRKVQFRTQRIPLYYYHNPDVTTSHLCNLRIFQYYCFLECHAMQSGDTSLWNVAKYITWHHTSKCSNLKKSSDITTTQYLYTVPRYTISTEWLFCFLQNYTNIHICTYTHTHTHTHTHSCSVDSVSYHSWHVPCSSDSSLIIVTHSARRQSWCNRNRVSTFCKISIWELCRSKLCDTIRHKCLLRFTCKCYKGDNLHIFFHQYQWFKINHSL